MDTKKLVHDLSRGEDIEYFLELYDLHFLRAHLKDLAENREYLYEPARRMLIELNKLKPLKDNPELLI